jgi:hypothetical protein
MEFVLCPEDEFRYFEDYLNSVLPGLFVYKYNSTTGNFSPDHIYWCVRRVPYDKLAFGTRVRFINTEQLTVPSKFNEYKKIIGSGMEIYDYSFANIRISGLGRYLPYKENMEETNRLKEFLKQEKEYDFAVIGTPSKHRTNLINYVASKGYSVCHAYGWNDQRDKQVGKCRYLLNLHYNPEYTVYESIRCERWRFAGMPIYSEESLDLPKDVKLISDIPLKNSQP